MSETWRTYGEARHTYERGMAHTLRPTDPTQISVHGFTLISDVAPETNVESETETHMRWLQLVGSLKV